MALAGSSSEALARTKTEYENFLGDAAMLKEVRESMKVSDRSSTTHTIQYLSK